MVADSGAGIVVVVPQSETWWQKSRPKEKDAMSTEELSENLSNGEKVLPADYDRTRGFGYDVDNNIDIIKTHASSFRHLFAPSVEAKIWGVGSKALHLASPPSFYPEYTKPCGTDYVYRDHDFWTSGFFPGSLYLLLERRRKLGSIRSPANEHVKGPSDLQLEYACHYWTENLHQNACLQDTHDVGFMIMPWARLEYELNHNLRALETIKTAAQSLFSRFNARIGCIRSWDRCVTRNYNFCNQAAEYMVIIDNMMNLDLLFYVASKTGNRQMHSAAMAHARRTVETHIRQDGSTTHLVVLDPQTGDVLRRLTNQGYSHTSCWARGQAWAIAGFAETYNWTHATEFLDTARRCADYFLCRIEEGAPVPWDFDAPRTDGTVQPPDSSAAVIAAYGMLLIHKQLTSLGQKSVYLAAALKIIDMVCSLHMNANATYVATAQAIETLEHGTTKVDVLHVDMGGSDTILNGATINNYEFAPRRWANHGLVYADYYFLRVGNLMLDLGLVPPHI